MRIGVVELVALDLDGTLLTSGKTITDRTKRVIHALINQQVKVLLATARPPRSVATTYKALKLKTCVICYNGALIYDPPTRKILAHFPIHLPLARSVINFTRELNCEILISVEVLDHWYTDRVNPAYQTETAKMFKPDKLAPIDTWLNCDVTKILLQGPDECLMQIREKIFVDHPGQLAMAQSENNLLQIMAGSVSKGNALRLVCEHYGIPLQKTIAVGDAPNDIDMLRNAGIGIAMADAPDRVKQAANYITMKNDEDGLADALEKFIL